MAVIHVILILPEQGAPYIAFKFSAYVSIYSPEYQTETDSHMGLTETASTGCRQLNSKKIDIYILVGDSDMTAKSVCWSK